MANYDPQTVRRGHIPPSDMMMEMQDAVDQASRAGGYGMVQYPGGNQFLPPDVEEIWAIVSGQGSGSYYGTGSGNAGSDNRYAWNQGMVVIAANGNETIEIDPSGTSGTQDVNPLIEVNGATDVPSGYVTRAYRSPSGNAWLFVFGGEVGSGSGGGMTVTCSDGTRYNVSINGNSIVVS